MKWKSLFAAALAAAVAVPAALAQETTGGGIPSGRVISVNFASGNNASYEIPADTAYGLVSAAGWNNVTGNSGTNVALSVSGASEGDSTASMTFAANGVWSYNAEDTDGFLRFFLGDNTHDGVDGATINVTDIPFDNYDVIVYLTTDTENVPFRPVSVNGKRYVVISLAETSVGAWLSLRTFLFSFSSEYVEYDGFVMDGVIIEKDFIEEIISGLDESGVSAVIGDVLAEEAEAA